MNLSYDPASSPGPRVEPPALAEREGRQSIAVVRGEGYVRLSSPTAFVVRGVPDDSTGRAEIVFQRLTSRDVALHLGAGPDGVRTVVSKDVLSEVEEMGAVELSRAALLALRREVDRHLGAAPRQDPAQEAAARQLLASTRTELASLQELLTGRLDALAEKIDQSAERITSLRAALARDVDELVRSLWPRRRDAK